MQHVTTEAFLSVNERGKFILLSNEPGLPYSPPSIAKAVATVAQMTGRLWVSRQDDHTAECGYLTRLTHLPGVQVWVDGVRYILIHNGAVDGIGDILKVKAIGKGQNFSHSITCSFLEPRGNNSLNKPAR